MSDKARRKEEGEQVARFGRKQDGRGTHVNSRGAGVVSSSKNRAQAIALIEFLARDDSQQWYAEANNEYPVRPDIAPSALLQSWGEFKADQVDASELGRLNSASLIAMDRARWS